MTIREQAEHAGGVVPGIWCPWAQILCAEDHGPRPESVHRPETHRFWDTAMDLVPLAAIDDGDVLTACDGCGRPVTVRRDLGWEHRLAAILRHRGWQNAHLAQTGGMCSAVYHPIAGTMPDGTEYEGEVWLVADTTYAPGTPVDDHGIATVPDPRLVPAIHVGETRYLKDNEGGASIPGYEGEDSTEYADARAALRAVERLIREGDARAA